MRKPSQGIRRARCLALRIPRHLTAAAILLALPALLAGVSGCRRHPQGHIAQEVAASFDDSVLTVAEVRSRIPSGLSTADSLEMARAIVSGWTEDMLFGAYLPMDDEESRRIERMTADYARKLRADAYRKRMMRSQAGGVSQDSVRAYYEANRRNLLCEQPLVKGLLVIVAADSEQLPEIRRLVAEGTPGALAQLQEGDWPGVIGVHSFGDDWVDFEQMASEIPASFADPDRFAATVRDFETESGGMAFILHLTDHLPSGSEMPYGFAEPQIREILEQTNLESYRRRLVRGLRDKARRQGRLRD